MQCLLLTSAVVTHICCISARYTVSSLPVPISYHNNWLRILRNDFCNSGTKRKRPPPTPPSFLPTHFLLGLYVLFCDHCSFILLPLWLWIENRDRANVLNRQACLGLVSCLHWWLIQFLSEDSDDVCPITVTNRGRQRGRRYRYMLLISNPE
jgi:hypothetical protein